MTVVDGQPIEYAPRLPLRHSRRVRRLLVLICTLAALMFLSWKAGPPAWKHAELLYWQRRVMTYSPPRDQVVYDNDPAEAAKLLKDKEYSGSGNAASRFARPWERFYGLMSPPGRQSAATLFLHERKNSNGESRLVIVDFHDTGSTFFLVPKRSAALQGGQVTFLAPPDGQGARPTPEYGMLCRCVVIQPGGAFSAPRELSDEDRYTGIPPFLLTGHLRWYAGQADAADPTHFVIRCERNRKVFVIDGWLQWDDTVKLECRGNGE